MESGIENCNLRNWSEQFLDDFYPFQLGTIVKWSKGGNLSYGRFDLGRDQHRILVMRTAVDNAVSDHIDLRRRGNGPSVTLPKIAEQLLSGLGARASFCGLFPASPFRILDRDFSNLAIPLDVTLPLARRGVVRS